MIASPDRVQSEPSVIVHRAIASDHSAVLSVDKALLVVELLMAEEGALSAREIAARLAINRTTAHRLLNALIHRDWIEKPPGTSAYRLSVKFLALAHVAAQRRSFVEEIRPTLVRLSLQSRETVHLGVLDGFEVVHVDKVDSPERVGISSKAGSRAIPHQTGLGKALIAAGSDEYVEDYLAHWRERDPASAPDPDAFRAEIALTRARGYSIDDEEDSIGVRCLGVAVRGAGGEPIFSLSVTGPSGRFTAERLAACVPTALAAGRELSRQFGWSPPAEQPALAGG